MHSHALVETQDVGAGTRIWAFAHVCDGVRIGRDCNICDHTFIESGVSLGDRVTVKCGIYLWTGVACEDDVFLGPNVVFTNDSRPRSRMRPDAYPQTLVRRGASVGANATVLPGVTIGRWAMVGAGAVVTRDVPDHALVFGNPARRRGWVSHAGHPLRFDAAGAATCASSGRRYVRTPPDGDSVTEVTD